MKPCGAYYAVLLTITFTAAAGITLAVIWGIERATRVWRP